LVGEDAPVGKDAFVGKDFVGKDSSVAGSAGSVAGPPFMKIHLIDGTYELFRHFYAAPSAQGAGGVEVGATRGLLRSLTALLGEPGVTHVAIAFDHVIESFRNELYAGYKTGEGIDPYLFAQFPLAEEASRALGLVVWPMIEFEADDAMAAGAARWADEEGVEQVVLCSRDKDLAQCVRGSQVVMLDRMSNRVMDEAGVIEKWGVPPASIPDYLALVGDSADGFPGIPRWGAKSAAQVLAAYGTIEAIPALETDWSVAVRGARQLAENLRTRSAEAALFKVLATLRTDVPLPETLGDLRWRGARRQQLSAFCEQLGDASILDRVSAFID
jgi:5'-3' exonuclease